MLIVHEFRKLFSGKLMLLLLVLLLVADLVTCAVLNEPAELPTDEDAPDPELVALAESCYLADPQGTLAYYQDMQAQMDQFYEELMIYAGRPAGMEEPVAPVYAYTYSGEVNDYELLGSYFEQVGKSSEYANYLRKTIISITRSLEYQESFEGYEQTYAYQEQRAMLSVYLSLLADYTPTLGVVKGWGELFAYQEGGIFLLLAMLIVGSQIVLTDYTGQMTSILRSTRRGRFPTSLAKLGVGLAAVLPIAAVFTLAECGAIAWKVGLSSPFVAIQNIESYLYCPYPITIFMGVLLHIGLRTVAGMAFVVVMLLLARLIRRPIAVYGAGLLWFAANLLPHYFKAYNDFLTLNCFSLASGIGQIEKISYVNLFDLPYSLLGLMIAALAVAILPMGAIYLLLSTVHRGQQGRAPLRLHNQWLTELKKRFHSQKKTDSNAPRAVKQRRYPLSLFYFEGYKHLRIKTLLLVVLIALLQIAYTHQAFAKELTPNEKLWESYQEQFAGELTDERRREIDDLARYYALLRSNETLVRIGADENKEHNLVLGVLYFASAEEYVAETNLAYLRQPVVERLAAHADYLEQKTAETGVRGWLVKDTGLLRMMGQPMNVGLYLILLLLLSELFGYDGKFAPVLRISRNGRSATWRTKFIFAAVISLAIAVGFTAADWICYLCYFDLSALSAPLLSLQAYANVTSTITVGQYLVLVAVLRIVAALLLGLLIAGVSGCLSSARMTLLISGVVTLLPLALYFFGIDFCRYFDFTKLLSGDALWLLSWESGGVGLLIGFVAVVAAVVAGLVTASYRKFCK